VNILVDGEVAVEDLAYGESSGSAELAAGPHTIGIELAETGAGGAGGEGGAGGDGGSDPVFETDVTLAAGQDLTIVAYRTTAGDNPVNVFVFDNSTTDLATGEGRVSVGHGADDPLLNPVDVYTLAANGAGGNGGSGGCNELLPDFAFEDNLPAPPDVLDVPAGDLTIAVVEDLNPCPGGILLSRVATVTADVKSNLVVVDEDGIDGAGLNPEIYAIVGDADPIKLEAPE